VNGEAGTGLFVAGLLAAALLFLLDLVLSVSLQSVAHLSRVAVRRLAQESGHRLTLLEDLKAPQSSHRMATQLARQMALLGGSVLTGVAARGLGIAHPWLFGVLTGWVVGVLFCETLVARTLAQRDARAALRATAPVIRLVHAVLYPVTAPLVAILLRIGPGSEEEEADRDEDQDEELDALIEVGKREGILAPDEGEMMRSIVDLGETNVREIMTPRTDIRAFPATATVADVRRALQGAAHSRFPVYRDGIDNVVGILHVRDLMRAWEDGRDDAPVTAYVRPAFFVPETQSAATLLEQMREHTHIALVEDEYGGIAGLVTVEDLLEEIVGEMRDEHAVEEALVRREADGSFMVSGLAHVEHLEELFGLEVGDEREFDTVGGLVVSEMGRVPAVGETLDAHGLRFQVVEADRRRVYKVRVWRAEPASPLEAAS
jgi:putative hemolysin